MTQYSKLAGEKVEKALHEMHEGKLKSGTGNKKVTSRKQAIAIGLSEARQDGAKVPQKVAVKKAAAKKASPKKATTQKNAKNTTAKKSAPKKAATKKAVQKK